jgi:hypothetical protein
MLKVGTCKTGNRGCTCFVYSARKNSNTPRGGNIASLISGVAKSNLAPLRVSSSVFREAGVIFCGGWDRVGAS